MLKAFEQHLPDQDWTEVQAGVEVKLMACPDGQETFVLCRSQERRRKEQAIHQRFVQRIEEGLRNIEKDLRHARWQRDRGALERRIGRLLGRNSHAAGCFAVEVVEDWRCAAGYRLQWSKQEAWLAWSALSEGCYLLRTNLTEASAQQLWQTYMQLTDVEAVFRHEKTDLKIRPI